MLNPINIYLAIPGVQTVKKDLYVTDYNFSRNVRKIEIQNLHKHFSYFKSKNRTVALPAC